MTTKRRAQSPHELLTLADKNGDAYYVMSRNNKVFDVVSHGPEWVCLVRSGIKNARCRWYRWSNLSGQFSIEGDIDPYEMGEFT